MQGLRAGLGEDRAQLLQNEMLQLKPECGLRTSRNVNVWRL